MSQVASAAEVSSGKRSPLVERLFVQSSNAALWTLLSVVIGVGMFILLSILPQPYVMIDLFRIGLWPALAVVTTVGSIRGPLAGLLTGYLGALLYGLLVFHTVVTMSLNALAFGIMGFVVGFGHYDFSNGRSLVKLSIASTIGLVLAILVVVAVGLTVEVYADLVAIGFVMLPLLTVGIPSVLLLTPLLGWLWLFLQSKVLTKNAR
jgi:hypothetical protein